MLTWIGLPLADLTAFAAAVAAGIGLYIAARQLNARMALAKTAFEDSFTKEYRQIIRSIPTKALLGALLDHTERCEALSSFYHYVDLCNEQAYLHNPRKRIAEQTWKEWQDGIRGNLSRPEFRAAWSYIAHYSALERHEAEFASLRSVVPPIDYDLSNPYLPPPSEISLDVVG